jgi:prolyl 4-hydroxylase
MARQLVSRQSQRACASQAARPSLLATAAAFAVVALLSAGVSVDAAAKSNEYIEDTDRFPGWKGELPQQQPLGSDAITIGYGEAGKEMWRGEVKQISDSPRAFLYKKLLSDEECAYLINNAKERMTKSTVVDSATGKSMDSDVRTSTGSFYSRGQDEVIRRIEKRLSHISFLPVDNGEGLQILHYVNGQQYKPHEDFFHDSVNARPENGGQRVATVLMYLTTPEEGGETVFPKAQIKTTGPGWSDCAKEGLAVKATKGDALLFYSLKPNGETDPTSMHGSCPTLKGEKWSATKWIHTGSFGLSTEEQRAKWGECVDADDRCEEWALAGECKANPSYMNKYCRPACKVCDPDDPKNDKADMDAAKAQ